MNDILWLIYKNERCPECGSTKIEAECNDFTERMTIECPDCTFEMNVSYVEARKAGFEPLPDRNVCEVVVLDDVGEVRSRFNIRQPGR